MACLILNPFFMIWPICTEDGLLLPHTSPSRCFLRHHQPSGRAVLQLLVLPTLIFLWLQRRANIEENNGYSGDPLNSHLGGLGDFSPLKKARACVLGSVLFEDHTLAPSVLEHVLFFFYIKTKPYPFLKEFTNRLSRGSDPLECGQTPFLNWLLCCFLETSESLETSKASALFSGILERTSHGCFVMGRKPSCGEALCGKGGLPAHGQSRSLLYSCHPYGILDIFRDSRKGIRLRSLKSCMWMICEGRGCHRGCLTWLLPDTDTPEKLRVLNRFQQFPIIYALPACLYPLVYPSILIYICHLPKTKQ